MEPKFEISFNFPLEHSQHTIPLRATAQLHHSDPYYVVDQFHFAGTEKISNVTSMLPAIEIIYRKSKDGELIWLHKDSERESLLSRSVGKAIESSPGFSME